MSRFADWLWGWIFGTPRWDRLMVDDALLDDPIDNPDPRGTMP